MPFFLKPCLRLRKKKNKKKSKLEEKIKRVSDVTVPVSTDVIWQECEISSSSTSNLSNSLSDLNMTKCLTRPTISGSEEISANVSTVNQGKDVSSQNTCIAVTDENMSFTSDEEPENVCFEKKNSFQADIDIERKENTRTLQTASDEQVGDINKTDKSIVKDDAENSEVPLNEETFSEPDDLRFPDIQVNIDIERKEAPRTLQTVSDEQVGDIIKIDKSTLKDGAENSLVPLNEETFSEPNDLRFPDIQVNIDIERKEAPRTLQTVGDEQVGDIIKRDKSTLKDGAENSLNPLNEETFSEPNDLRFPDLNKIDINMDVMKKIDELRSIQNSFPQGDQSMFENIVGKNNKNMSEEFLSTDNKNAESLIKHLNSPENKLRDGCSKIRTKRNNFTCATFRDKFDYDADSKEHVNETFSEYVSSEGNFASAKQSRTDRSNDIGDENSSLNSTISTENEPETEEIDSQSIGNAYLNAKKNLSINYSIDASEHSDMYGHETPSINSIQTSSDNANTFTTELYNLLQTEHTRNECHSKKLCLNEMETYSNATVESSDSISSDESAISEDTSLSTESETEMNISKKVTENNINDKDCNNDEFKLVGYKIKNYFNSENSVEVYEIKNESIEIEYCDEHQCNLNIRSGHAEEFKVGGSKLDESQEEHNLLNTLTNSEIKREEEKDQQPVIDGDEQFSLDGNKYSHLTLQENELFTQINARLPLNYEEVISFNHSENVFRKEYISLDLEEGSNFGATQNDEHEESSLYVKQEFEQEGNIHNYNEKFSGKERDINSFPGETENTSCNSLENTEIFHDISSSFNNEKNKSRNGGREYEGMHSMHEYSSVENNPCCSAQNVDSIFYNTGSNSKVLKRSTEENIEIAEDLFVHSDGNTNSCNEIILPTEDKERAKEYFQSQPFTKSSENTECLEDEDNYSAKRLPKMSNDVTNHHYDNNLHSRESVEEVHDYEKQNVYDGETCDCHQIEDTFQSENTISEETNNEEVLENYTSNVLDEMYEKYYAFQNTQRPKRLNRFSSISSTSESSMSSIFSDKSCSKVTEAKKKESRSFSISACGDTRNNENINEPIDDFKLSDTVNDMIKLEEAKKAVARNEHHGLIREPKITINIITKKNKNDEIKATQYLTNNQSGDNFEKIVKSIGLSGIDRIRESIEVFNKKKEQALSDMKPNIRTIPVKKPDVSKTKNKTEKLGRHQKARSPFLKVNQSSNLNGHEKNLKELMPESLFEINKNVERHSELHQKYNVGKLLRKNSPEISPTSDSDSESSRRSEDISPARKHILNTSRDIRSPKYPFRNLQRLPMGNSHYIKRPVLIKSPKVNLVAYLTKDEKNRYILKKGYRMYNKECGKFQIFSPDYRRSDNKTDHIGNACNNRSTSPDYLKLKFDDMFRRYARKGRTNGELISYKRSTEWLRDAGIIGKSLTVEEANNAFKCTAGVKVTLNRGDYRHYLMKLARIKKLNYNEIYKRLCFLNNRLIE